MRRIPPTPLLLAGALLTAAITACTSRPPETPPEVPPVTPSATAPEASRSWTYEVSQSSKLQGTAVEESRDGPWTVRRTARAGGGSGSAPARGLKRESSLGVDAGRPADRFDVGGGGVDGAPGALTGGADSAEPHPDASTLEEGGGATESLMLPKGVEPPTGAAPSAGAEVAAPASRGEPGPSGESVPLAIEHAAPLRAGSTDDNQEFEKFLDFLESWRSRVGSADRVDALDVSGRKFLRVLNRKGAPVPGARVLLVDEEADRIVWGGTTYGDGRIPYYPNVPLSDDGPPAASKKLIVEASLGGIRSLKRWDGSGDELVVELDVEEPVREPIALDVLFLIDTTGSMGDEIGRIKATLLEVTRRLRSIEREFDLRYGAVLYRDLGDEYVTKAHPFTGDIEAFDGALRSVAADGGGDGPESLNQGLAEAVGRADWRTGAAKVVFLIADAPPHMDYQGDVRYGESLKAAVDRGIRIHAVAASGLDPRGTYVFRQIAQFARGQFIFIEYGTAAESAASHGVAGTAGSNNLDEIIFDRIREEVAHWGRV